MKKQEPVEEEERGFRFGDCVVCGTTLWAMEGLKQEQNDDTSHLNRFVLVTL